MNHTQKKNDQNSKKLICKMQIIELEIEIERERKVSLK